MTVDALWTMDGLPPRWNNLGLLCPRAGGEDQEPVERWRDRFESWPARGCLLYGAKDLTLLVRERRDVVREVEVPGKDLDVHLRKWRSFFTPSGLAPFQTGQLSLYDSLGDISPSSLIFLQREQAHLKASIEKALDDGYSELKRLRKTDALQDLVYVAIAYLAARVLEDKRFFEGNEGPTIDPRALLRRTCKATNGFFTKAHDEALPNVPRPALQVLAARLGARANFSLVDHRDVGHLYEHLLAAIPDNRHLSAFKSLQSHYTPLALAERMAQAIPIEELEPGHRVALDPAAGSGSLLLAMATRLGAAKDRAESQLIGNDLNPTAELMTQLRFTLALRSSGAQLKRPVFLTSDYETLEVSNLPAKPMILLANPPFEERGEQQRAAAFVQRTLYWLSPGSFFGLVLPHSFLTATTHGILAARGDLASKCRVLDVWQAPEGVVGHSARQPICVVIAKVGASTERHCVARAVISGAEKTAVRDQGYLGQAWLASIPVDDGKWTETIVPPRRSIPTKTVRLGELFDVFSGVTMDRRHPPSGSRLSGKKYKRFWKTSWLPRGTIWADPGCVDETERWIRYSQETLEGPRLEHEDDFDRPKVFAGRVVNRNSANPLKAHFDSTGFCPDNNVFCMMPRRSDAIPGWEHLDREARLLWLLGLLRSTSGIELSMSGRASRHMTKEAFESLPLPARVDEQIIRMIELWLRRDQQHLTDPATEQLQHELDGVVDESYGARLESGLSRVGQSWHFFQWQKERSQEAHHVVGRILEVRDNSVHVYLSAWDEDRDFWMKKCPAEFPGWALDGQSFIAQLSSDVSSPEELEQRVWALRDFKPMGRPYLDIEDVERSLVGPGFST